MPPPRVPPRLIPRIPIRSSTGTVTPPVARSPAAPPAVARPVVAPPAVARPVVARPVVARPVVLSPAPAGPVALAAHALELIAEVRVMRGEAARQFHRIGTVYLTLARKEVLDALGCTFEELLEQHDLGARMTAAKYMAVAAAFTEEEAIALGSVDKGFAIVRYTQVAGVKAPPAELWKGNATIVGKPLHSHTAATLREATVRFRLRLRERAEAEDDTVAEADAAVRKLGARLRKAGATTAALRRVRKRGRYMVAVLLDPDEAVAVAEALRTT